MNEEALVVAVAALHNNYHGIRHFINQTMLTKLFNEKLKKNGVAK